MKPLRTPRSGIRWNKSSKRCALGSLIPRRLKWLGTCLRARLLGLAEDREGFFRYQLREGLTGGSQSPQALWQRIEQVGVKELAHVAAGIAADTAFLLHGT